MAIIRTYANHGTYLVTVPRRYAAHVAVTVRELTGYSVRAIPQGEDDRQIWIDQILEEHDIQRIREKL